MSRRVKLNKATLEELCELDECLGNDIFLERKKGLFLDFDNLKTRIRGSNEVRLARMAGKLEQTELSFLSNIKKDESNTESPKQRNKAVVFWNSGPRLSDSYTTLPLDHPLIIAAKESERRSAEEAWKGFKKSDKTFSVIMNLDFLKGKPIEDFSIQIEEKSEMPEAKRVSFKEDPRIFLEQAIAVKYSYHAVVKTLARQCYPSLKSKSPYQHLGAGSAFVLSKGQSGFVFLTAAHCLLLTAGEDGKKGLRDKKLTSKCPNCSFIGVLRDGNAYRSDLVINCQNCNRNFPFVIDRDDFFVEYQHVLHYNGQAYEVGGYKIPEGLERLFDSSRQSDGWASVPWSVVLERGLDYAIFATIQSISGFPIGNNKDLVRLTFLAANSEIDEVAVDCCRIEYPSDLVSRKIYRSTGKLLNFVQLMRVKDCHMKHSCSIKSGMSGAPVVAHKVSNERIMQVVGIQSGYTFRVDGSTNEKTFVNGLAIPITSDCIEFINSFLDSIHVDESYRFGSYFLERLRLNDKSPLE